MKTLVGGLCVATSMAQATPIPVSPTEQVRIFALCAGRMSALEQHQWMVDGPASEATARLVGAFTDLVDAVAPVAADRGLPEAQAAAWRVEAWAAERELLARSVFGEDARTRDRAASAAEAQLGMCRGLLLQG